MQSPISSRGAKSKAKNVENSKTFQGLIALGLTAYGVVHVLVAWISVQLAWGGGGGKADQKGALQQLAGTALGPILLWIVAVGLIALVVWRLGSAAFGYTWKTDPKKRLAKRIGAAGSAIVYGVIAVSAIKTAIGAGQSSGGTAQKSLTAKMLGNPFGIAVLLIIAVAIIAVGVNDVRKSIKSSFTEELAGSVSEKIIKFGQVGYAAKGIALVITGALFAWAALSHDPNKAGGLDKSLRTVLAQPFGSILLTLMALGFLCFGIFCFGWARHPRKE